MGVFKNNENSTFNVNTKLIFNNLSEKAKDAAKMATYRIVIPSGQHYTSAIFNDYGSNGFRFDPCCMKPVNKSAKYFHAEFTEALNRIKPITIKWTGNKALILDNWKTMHGRSAIRNISQDREMFRIYVG